MKVANSSQLHNARAIFRYFTLELWILTSNGYKREVIFLGRKAIFMLLYFSNKDFWVYSCLIQKQDHFFVFTNHMTVKVAATNMRYFARSKLSRSSVHKSNFSFIRPVLLKFFFFNKDTSFEFE